MTDKYIDEAYRRGIIVGMKDAKYVGFLNGMVAGAMLVNSIWLIFKWLAL